MDVLFLMSIFRLYLGYKISLENKCVRIDLFLSACFCWILDFRSVRWTQNLNLVEPLAMLTCNWSFYFVTSMFLDYMQNYKMLLERCGHSYFYIIGRGRNSCSLGHVTGRLFCLHVKLFLLSIFKSTDF